MQIKKLITGMIAIAIAAIITVNVAAVTISDISHTTTTVENENPQWIRMAYLTDQSDYSVGYTIADNTITVTNGTDSQSGDAVNTILYADDTATVMVSDGTAHLLANVNDEDDYATLGTSFTVARSSGAVTVTDGDYSYNIGSDKTWVYVPLSTEKYGVFSTGNLNRHGGALAVAGSYAGVHCYNDICSQDLGFVMDAEYTDDYITSVKWALASAENVQEATEPTESVQNSNGIVLSAAPPSATYTDGDWGYNLTGSKATIVSYSGATGGVLTVPATVGGYTVDKVGIGTINNPVVNTESAFTDLVISEGITTINNYAFAGCSGFTGSLVLPSSVTLFFSNSFDGCSGFTGSLTLPANASLYANAFQNCSGFTSLSLPSNITLLPSNCFNGCSGFTGALTIPDSVTQIQGGVFAGCSGFTSLVLGNNVVVIREGAFQNCSGFTGTLTIPDSVTTIGSAGGNGTFQNCSGFTGTLTIPDTVTTIGGYAFAGCSGIDSLVLLSDATPGTNAFGMAGVKEVLDLSDTEYTTTSYGLNADSVQDYIDADSYLCITEVTETTQKEGAVYDLISIIPMLIVISIVIGAVWFIRQKY